MSNAYLHNLNYHSNVGATSPDNGDVLTWDAEAEMWVASPGGGSLTPHNLTYHSDVDIDSPATGEVLAYDGTEWVNMAVPGSGPISIDDLTDVVITTPASGHVLAYDGTNWVNQAAAAVSSHNLDFHSDVNAPTPTNGQYLTYNTSLNSWVATTLSLGLDNMSDVVITTPAEGDILQYDGTTWENVAMPSQPLVAHVLNSHSDVNVPAPSSGEVLTWSGTEWVADNPISQDLDDLDDVNITSGTSGDILVYNGTTWVNTAQTSIKGKTENNLKVLRGILTRTGDSWAVTEGTGFTVGSASYGSVCTIFFTSGFSDTPTVTLGHSAAQETNGGTTFSRLAPSITSVNTTQCVLTEQLLQFPAGNIATSLGMTPTVSVTTHFTITGPST